MPLPVVPRRAWWLALVVWCALIFALSAQPHLELSDRDMLDLVVRKLGHAFEYGVMVVLATLSLRAEGVVPRRARAIALAFAVLYAASDEFHQRFVPGRSGHPRDVAIDAAGALLAWYLLGRSARRTAPYTPAPTPAAASHTVSTEDTYG